MTTHVDEPTPGILAHLFELSGHRTMEVFGIGIICPCLEYSAVLWRCEAQPRSAHGVDPSVWRAVTTDLEHEPDAVYLGGPVVRVMCGRAADSVALEATPLGTRRFTIEQVTDGTAARLLQQHLSESLKATG